MIVDKLYLTKRLPPKDSSDPHSSLSASIVESVTRKSSFKTMSSLKRLQTDIKDGQLTQRSISTIVQEIETNRMCFKEFGFKQYWWKMKVD